MLRYQINVRPLRCMYRYIWNQGNASRSYQFLNNSDHEMCKNFDFSTAISAKKLLTILDIHHVSCTDTLFIEASSYQRTFYKYHSEQLFCCLFQISKLSWGGNKVNGHTISPPYCLILPG